MDWQFQSTRSLPSLISRRPSRCDRALEIEESPTVLSPSYRREKERIGSPRAKQTCARLLSEASLFYFSLSFFRDDSSAADECFLRVCFFKTFSTRNREDSKSRGEKLSALVVGGKTGGLRRRKVERVWTLPDGRNEWIFLNLFSVDTPDHDHAVLLKFGTFSWGRRDSWRGEEVGSCFLVVVLHFEVSV